MSQEIFLVFVHGYSVTNVDTYGQLPIRLKEEGKKNGLDIQVNEIYLGKYISFNDNVTLNDISKAFNHAVNTQLAHLITAKKQFVCITHSTGGPVARNWWYNFYSSVNKTCPMSHLIMLAPANFGSALAQLGKGKLSRIKAWFDGVEPGQKVLDWLELGSNAAWKLNKEWITSDGKQISEKGFYPFVITGQSIDRKLYDNLNSYTGELGSDGVVRVAACNLNSQYLKLVQPSVQKDASGKYYSKEFKIESYITSPSTAMRIVTGKSHSGEDMGILRSVKANNTDTASAETVNAIMNCIKVSNLKQYQVLTEKFNKETKQVQTNELLETDTQFLLLKRTFIHDQYSQVIFKVIDQENNPIYDYDLILTAGVNDDPNHLPQGFFVDRQKNRLNTETITYYFNYSIMAGGPEVKNSKNEVVRNAMPGAAMLGIEIRPRPDDGFVKYVPCKIKANKELLQKALKPNSTTLIEIVLQRIISTNVFSLNKIETMPTKKQGDFGGTKSGENYI